MGTEWTEERIKEIQEYSKTNDASMAETAKALKFSVASYYANKARIAKGIKRKYTKQVTPKKIELEMLPSSSKVVVLIADRSQIKSILAEVF